MPRNENHPELFSPFSKWLRAHPIELPSNKNDNSNVNEFFTFNNLDYVCRKYNHKNEELEFMLIEEKRQDHLVPFSQFKTYNRLDLVMRSCDNYRGVHILQLNKDEPRDGMRLDGREITETDLIEFLQFKKPLEMYKTPSLSKFVFSRFKSPYEIFYANQERVKV